MALDQGLIEGLLPDNTTEQISPQDLRDSFAEVARAYDGLSVSYITASVTADGGDGTIEGDVAAMDFSGNAVPDPAPDTFITVPTATLLQFAYRGRAYFWNGPADVTIGVGGSYVPTNQEFILSGVFDHEQLQGTSDADSHPQSAITGLVTALANLVAWDAAHDADKVPHPQYMTPEQLPAANATYLSKVLNGSDYSLLSAIPYTAEDTIVVNVAAPDTLVGTFARAEGSPFNLYQAQAWVKVTLDIEAPPPGVNIGVYVEGYIDHTPNGGVVELVGTSATYPVAVGRNLLHIDLFVLTPFVAETGDLTMLKVYASPLGGAGDDTLTLYVDGHGSSKSIIPLPTASLPYAYTKVSNILNIPAAPTWTPIATVSIENTPAGTYEFGLSVTGVFPNTTNPLRLRYTHDGNPWSELIREQKDITDTADWYYAYPKALAAGDHSFEVEAQKGGSGNSFDIQFADVWIERKT